MTARKLEDDRRKEAHIKIRRQVLERILFQFETYGEVATFPEDASLQLAGNGEDPRVPVALRTKSRAEGVKTQIHEDVQEWAVNEYTRLLREEGLTAEAAKDWILNTAARHDYHFSRRTLERYI